MRIIPNLFVNLIKKEVVEEARGVDEANFKRIYIFSTSLSKLGEIL
jgi:hypothetical protein